MGTPAPRSEVLDRIRAWLTSRGIAFHEQQHAPTRTSAESAEARGESLGIGGKALLLKADERFVLCVLPADRKLDSKGVKQALAVRKLRFATAEELLDMTGLVPGSVPPFGEPILPFALLVDQALTDNPRIAFNAGSLTDSMTLAMDDYLAVASPQITPLSSAAGTN